MNNLRKYLILLELISFRRIDFDIIKKKYRELAMRFHPDITGRDSNKEMAEINNSYEFLIRNISAANEELKNIWKEKEAEFARVYRDAIINNLSSATISQLRRSINLFNTIAGYKDVKDLITKYTVELNKKLKEEARKEAIYKDAILDVRKASIGELEKAISLLKNIPNYKDSNNLVLIYKNQIDKLKEEIKQNESYYKKLHQIKNDSISDAEFNKIISFLNSYSAPGSEELLNHFYHRQNQFASVEKRLENERNEKIYILLLSEFNKASTIKDFKDIISKYTKIKGYKNVDSILSQCKSSIENIIAREEYERKEKLYSEAIDYLKQIKDNSMLQKAIDLLKTIRDFKESEELIAKAVGFIFDNNEEDRKSKIYNKGITNFETNDFKYLEDILKELNTVDEYKNIDNLKKEYQNKIDKLKNDLYKEAKIEIANTTIDELEKSIVILKKIDGYKDSSKLINLYHDKIFSIKQEEEAKKKADLEEVYLRGLIGDDEEMTEKLLKDKIKILLSIQSYKESRKIIQSYKKYLSELQSERRKKHFRKYSMVFLKFYLPVLIFIISTFFITTKVVIPTTHYNKGVDFFNSGDYVEARKYLSNKFKNAEIYIIVIDAIEELENDNYDDAIEILNNINAVIDIKYDDNKTTLLSSNNNHYNPSYDGYDFDDWKLKDYKINIKGDIVNADIELIATWKLSEYNIVIDLDGGTITEDYKSFNKNDSITFIAPTKKGYHFSGWKINNDPKLIKDFTILPNSIYHDLNMKAMWNKYGEFNLTFDYMYDNLYSTIIIKELDQYANFPVLSRVGYDFIGWFTDNDEIVQEGDSFTLNDDQTVHAKWAPKTYNITYKNFNNDFTIEIEYDTKITNLPFYNISGYNFIGWFYNDEVITEGHIYNYANNITLNPKHEIITYKIFVFINNVYKELTNYNVKDSDIALNEYYIDGYEISNYYYNDNLLTSINTSLAKDIYLTADYSPLEYNIFFDGEDTIFSIHYGEVMSVINDYTPIKIGYNFINWEDVNGKNYFGDEIFDFLDDIILYAKWEPKEFQLTLNYDQDNKPNEIRNVLFNSKIESLPNPVKKGHDFIGWFDNGDNIFIEGNKYLFNTNMELVAKWELTVYEVSFDMVRTGYTNPTTQFVSIYSPLTYPSSFITGEFAGWYDNPQYSGEPYDFTAPLSKDIKLYAKWNFTVNLFDDRTYPMLPLNNVSRNVEFRTLAGGEINIRAYNTGEVIVGLLDSKGNVIDFVVKDIHSGIIEFNFIAEPNSVYRLEITRQGVYAEISFLKIQGNRIPPDGGIPSNG